MNARGLASRAACLAAVLASCAVTPLSNRIEVGEEPFVIGVAEGSDGNTDLFAAPASGGNFVRLTFTRTEERGPRLSPDGTRLAFLRSEANGAVTRWTVVALDLRTGAERATVLPAGAPEPLQLGWSPENSTVVVLAGGYSSMDARSGPSDLRPVPEESVGMADSVVRELLGEPAVGMVVQCPGGGACVAAKTGEVTSLGAGVTEPVRWGADSVGYFAAGGFEVRPLAGGRSRRPVWSAVPRGLRSITYHPGRHTTLTGGVSGVR